MLSTAQLATGQSGCHRLRARAEHAGATERATKTVERLDRALLRLDSRQSTLLEQLARERAARQPERVREPAVRAREQNATWDSVATSASAAEP